MPHDPVSRVPVSRQRTTTSGFGKKVVPAPPRRSRSKLAVTAVLVLAFIAAGYLLIMRHVDPATARSVIQAELASLSLEPGERVERTAFVYQRSPWDYFRSSYGAITATDRRLLVLTIAPSDRFAREVERPVVERREFLKDTALRIDTGRVMLGLEHGVTIRSHGLRAAYGVASGGEPAIAALIRNVRHRQDSIQAAAVEARRQRALLAEVMRRPVWVRVQRGDALASIATRFNTTPERLREINHLEKDRIRVGDSLMIKPPTP